MTDKAHSTISVAARITEYLGNGGLWNHELMKRETVRELLIDARTALLARSWTPKPSERPTGGQ